MKIVADENMLGTTVARLRQEGHDVEFIRETARSSKDPQVLALANQRQSLLITNDKGFGDLVFKKRLPTYGVLLIRLPYDEETERVAAIIQAEGEALFGFFTTIDSHGQRKRPIH